MDKEKKYFKELRKKVDIYFVIIISILSSLSVYMLYERKIINQEIIYVLMAILTISFIVYILSIRKNFKSKNINELDKAMFIFNIFLITSLLMIIIIKSIKNRDLLLIYNLTKSLFQRNITMSFTLITIIIIIVLTVLSLISIIIRFFLYKNKNIYNKSEANKQIVYTLSDIYYSFSFNDMIKLQKKDKNIILIEDNIKIQKDLFGRNQIINNLSSSISSSMKYNNCFTIGVVGEWGSGKSTIIELVKEDINKNEILNKNVVIVDDFDPWAIKSQDALVLAFYNTIIENLGENIDYFKRKKIQNALINISTNIPYIGKGIGSFFDNRIDDYTEYKEIKADLKEKLENSNKRLIFIIDNLDRMNSNNVLFLLTLIGTLFKLPNITYIVAYDKDRMNTIFKIDKINSKYLEKIINKEIVIPKIHDSVKQNIFYNCLKKCIIWEGCDEFSDEIPKKIATKFDNIRSFIKFLNLIIYDINYTSLYQYDYLIIRTIEFLDYNLYLKIYDNKDFVTKIIKDENDFKGKYKDFYEEIKLSSFFDLLQLLSGSLSNFNILKNLKENKNLLTNKRIIENYNFICNSFYFENYFSFSKYTKEYIEIKNHFELKYYMTYKKTKTFFDKNKKYLENSYLDALQLYLIDIESIENNDKIINAKLYLFIYFLEKIVNNIFNEYTYILLKTYTYRINKSIIDVYKEISNNFSEDFKRERTDYLEKIRNIFITIAKSEEFFYLEDISDNFYDANKFNKFLKELSRISKKEYYITIFEKLNDLDRNFTSSNKRTKEFLKNFKELFQNIK
ncbi:KAP family P-loop NTPase fold protein [Parvimonas micra]|uniref:KAP family P-loop NTPase fold protein n=1 Tax=Parvimonas micra TaxID=33033 RepID=UPI0003F64BB7|nr:P-loop NTPase fold protein [Parvimonas micra]